MSNKRSMMFVDAQNLINGAEDYYGGPKQMDPAKLVEVLTHDYDLIRPYWFTSHPPNSKPHDFYHFLRMEGNYRVVSTPRRQRGDRHVEKGVDIQLATELIAQGFNDSYDIAVLVSGDADYERAVRYVQDHGKVVVGAMFEGITSGDLKGLVDRYVDLENVADEIRNTS